MRGCQRSRELTELRAFASAWTLECWEQRWGFEIHLIQELDIHSVFIATPEETVVSEEQGSIWDEKPIQDPPLHKEELLFNDEHDEPTIDLIGGPCFNSEYLKELVYVEFEEPSRHDTTVTPTNNLPLDYHSANSEHVPYLLNITVEPNTPKGITKFSSPLGIHSQKHLIEEDDDAHEEEDDAHGDDELKELATYVWKLSTYSTLLQSGPKTMMTPLPPRENDRVIHYKDRPNHGPVWDIEGPGPPRPDGGKSGPILRRILVNPDFRSSLGGAPLIPPTPELYPRLLPVHRGLKFKLGAVFQPLESSLDYFLFLEQPTPSFGLPPPHLKPSLYRPNLLLAPYTHLDPLTIQPTQFSTVFL